MKKYFICLLLTIVFSANANAQLTNKLGRKMISKVTINTNLGAHNKYNTTTISFTYNLERELVGIYFCMFILKK